MLEKALQNPIVFAEKSHIKKRFLSLLTLFGVASLFYLTVSSCYPKAPEELYRALNPIDYLFISSLVISLYFLPWVVFYRTLDIGRKYLNPHQEELKASKLTHREFAYSLLAQYALPWGLALFIIFISVMLLSSLLSSFLSGIPIIDNLHSLFLAEEDLLFKQYFVLVKYLAYCGFTALLATTAVNFEFTVKRQYSIIGYILTIIFVLFALAIGLEIAIDTFCSLLGIESWQAQNIVSNLITSFTLPWGIGYFYGGGSDLSVYLTPLVWLGLFTGTYRFSQRLFDGKVNLFNNFITPKVQAAKSWRGSLLKRLWRATWFRWSCWTLLSLFFAILCFLDILDGELIIMLFVGFLWMMPPIKASRVLHQELSKERWSNLMVTQLTKKDVIKAQFWKGYSSLLEMFLPFAGIVTLCLIKQLDVGSYLGSLVFLSLSLWSYYTIAFSIQLLFNNNKTDLKLITGWVFLHLAIIIAWEFTANYSSDLILSILPASMPFQIIETFSFFTHFNEILIGVSLWFFVSIFFFGIGYNFNGLREVEV